MKEMTFFSVRQCSLKSAAMEGQSWRERARKKRKKEDRVNEMASKHELNGGRKATRSNLSCLGSLQTPFSTHEVFQSLDSWPRLLKGTWC